MAFLIRLITDRLGARNKSIFYVTIAKIVTLSIALGLAAVLIAYMVMQGFQAEIKKNSFLLLEIWLLLNIRASRREIFFRYNLGKLVRS